MSARLLVVAFVFAVFSLAAVAKDARPTAIVLFDAPSGPAYVQITGLAVNGKTELRVCDGAPKFDKRAYDAFLKTQISEATAMERDAQGTLHVSINGKSFCVVPAGLKFEKNADLTPADGAEQALLQGLVVASSLQNPSLPALKPGTKIFFVPAPDAEYAEYLLAQRAQSIPTWQAFLSHYPASARINDAKNALAAIYEEAGESAFAEYRKSIAHTPDFAHLKLAQQQAEQAEKVAPGYQPARKLREQIAKELDTLLDSDRTKLQNFRKALAEHTVGYSQLVAASQHSAQVLDVDPQYAPAANLHAELSGEEHKLNSALETAEGLVTSKRYDDAVKTLGPYSIFAPELPRIRAVMSAAYAFHFGRGQDFGKSFQWDQAAVEYRRAKEISADNKEVDAALKNAELQLETAKNRQAADRAIAESNSYAQKSQFIEAYEVLANLPASQQSYVAEQLTALQKNYVTAAFRRAQKLQEVHLPIRGRADEDAIREAYDLLDRASAVSGDPAMRLRLDLLSDKVGAYYLEQAKRYLDKPSASGVGLGWLYLGEAEHYKPHMEAVKEAMARYAPAYQLRSRLSIGVVLRDQTSRRDSLGFADQLRDAIANGLESSGLSIKVVRQFNETDQVQPNFQLIAEILEHRVVKDTTLETLQSKYRAATHDVKNPVWLQANSDYEAAQQQLAAAQRALADAQAQHKKKEIVTAATEAVTAAQQHVADTHRKLDSTEQTRSENVIEPYNYTKKNVDLAATVDTAFRINDQSGNVLETTVPVRKSDHKVAVVLENVKPEDTEGIKKQSTEPDEIQFLTDLEIQARDALIKSVQEKVLSLPAKILAQARSRAQQGDLDGAAEQYIVYLNAVSDPASQERAEAAKFLHDHFNVTTGASAPTESKLVQYRGQ